MSVTKGVLASLLFSAASAVAFTGPETADVNTCIAQDNAKYCLKEDDLYSTACCDTTADAGAATDGCKWAAAQTSLCTTNANKVMNRFFR